MPIKVASSGDVTDSYIPYCYDDGDDMVTSSISMANSVGRSSDDENEGHETESEGQGANMPKKRGPKKKPMTKARIVKIKVRMFRRMNLVTCYSTC
jgi:hypothetical protein